MANTKVTSRVLADDAVTVTKLHTQSNAAGFLGNQDPTDGYALVAKATASDYYLSWESVGVAGISSSADATAITIDSSERVGIGTASITEKTTLNGALSVTGAVSTNPGSSGTVSFESISGVGDGLSLSSYAPDATSLANIYFRTGYGGATPDIRMTIDGAGSVGIGTSSLSRQLQLYKTSNSSYSSSSMETTNLQLYIRNADTTVNNHVGLQFAVGNNSDAAIAGVRTSDANAALTFGTRGTGSGNIIERMRIDSSGKLLIGDSASHVDDLLQIETPASGGGHGIQIRRNDSNSDQGIGRVMFGNNTDTDLATIQAITDGGSDNARLVFSTQPSSGSSTERMRIKSNGQVLINATNANYPTDYATEGSVATTIIRGPETAATDNALFVYGGRIALNAHPARYATRAYIQSDGGGMKIWHTDNSDMIFAVNNQEKVRIQYSDGIIKCFGIYAHATSGTVRDVYIEDGGQLGYSSSVRAHKTNITDYSDASWLYDLNPKQFNRRKKNMVIETNDDGVDHTVHDGTYSDTEFHTPVEVGFIAEDVEALDSKLCFYDVVTDEDGNESEQLAGIHYKNMVAPMLKLIQEQKTLIDDLTSRIETLEG